MAKTSKKAPTKKAPAKKVVKAPPAPPMKTVKLEATSAESAVDEIMLQIDEHEYANPGVSRSESLDFYNGIGNACLERAELIETELEKEGEGESGGGEEG